MKVYLLALSLLFGFTAFTQPDNSAKLPQYLPKELQIKEVPHSFKIVTAHYNYDIFGNILNKQQVTGDYTRGLPDGKSKWNNVTVSFSNVAERDAEFESTENIPYMENYTYLPGNDMLLAEKFTTFSKHAAFTKNLIWDMMCFEVFAWNFWDKLELNKEYSTPEMNFKVDLAGEGYFENKDIRLLYAGISEKNGEQCALINFRTFNNPLELGVNEMQLKGRSHYWGTVWVSLEDKQIEEAVLYEDVVMEMKMHKEAPTQIINTTREISCQRIF